MSNALEVACGRHVLGQIDDEGFAPLKHWIDKGFVVLKGAVPLGWLDALQQDFDAVWLDGHPQAWVDVIENGRSTVRRLKIGDLDRTDILAKLLDLHEYLETARTVTFAPAMAFQSLSFNKGSRQPIHQDTAFVRVSSPMEFSASWVALEDVQPETGELIYYEGSHRFPEYRYEGKYKWFPPGNTEVGQHYKQIAECASAQGSIASRFLPKRGDVPIWSADLAHGGSEIHEPSRNSEKPSDPLLSV
jgi:phytanoyl-CoA hydroxylase